MRSSCPTRLPEEMLKNTACSPSRCRTGHPLPLPQRRTAFAARRRLIYEELLVLQLGIGRMKNRGSASTGAPMQRLDPAPFWHRSLSHRASAGP